MIEEDIIAAIGSIVSGKVYYETAPQGYPIPFCIFQQVGGVPSNALCGNTNKQNGRFKFYVWDVDAKSAMQKMKAMEAVLTAPPIYATSLGSPAAIYDEATRRKGAWQDLSIWS